MFIPNQFKASNVARMLMYDAEGRMRVTRTNSPKSEDGGIADTNSMYATEAERFGNMAPFLKKNKAKDALRRNYIIQPGGACIYFDGPVKLEDPYGGGRVQYTPGEADFPEVHTSFGHGSQDAMNPQPHVAVNYTTGSGEG